MMIIDLFLGNGSHRGEIAVANQDLLGHSALYHDSQIRQTAVDIKADSTEQRIFDTRSNLAYAGRSVWDKDHHLNEAISLAADLAGYKSISASRTSSTRHSCYITC
jgi:hypothetical protein